MEHELEISVVFDDERELTSIEYSNLCNKTNTGALPVEYLRKNLFNATTRESKELTRNKTIYDDGKLKIKVNRSLHQKHRDLLSIIFTDNRGVKKPNKDGSYLIFHNLYDLAKKMGYPKPLSAIGTVQKFLNDLRYTDMVVENGRYKQQHMLLGKFELDKETNNYAIKIPPETAKFHILNYSVEIPREINRKIIEIPNNLAKIKALVSYMLSNQALKNGISFESVCDKLDINIPARKSEFLKEIRSNLGLLQEFNITFNEETKIFKYEQIEAIKFHSPVKIEKIIELIESEKSISAEDTKTPSLFAEIELLPTEEKLNINEERYKKIILSFLDTEIIINDTKYIFKGLEKNENGEVALLILNDLGMCKANTRLTSYFAVYGSYFKEFV